MGDIIINNAGRTSTGKRLRPWARWEPEEDEMLLKLVEEERLPLKRVAEELGRSFFSVTSRLRTLRTREGTPEKVEEPTPTKDDVAQGLLDRAVFLSIVQLEAATLEEIEAHLGVPNSAPSLGRLLNAGRIFMVGNAYLPSPRTILRLGR